MKTICIVNQKVGCSKTSTAVNLSSLLAEMGHKTLLIDMDPQGNASSSLNIDNFNSPTIYEVLHGGTALGAAILETGIVNLYMIASNIMTAKLEREMSKIADSEY
jgi:chromosome partitioning protein